LVERKLAYYLRSRFIEDRMNNTYSFARLIALLALASVLVTCSQAPPPQATNTPTPTSSQATAISAPSPTLTPPPLGLAPQNCHSGPTPRTIFSDVGPGVGRSPIWAFGLDTTIRIPSYFTYTQYGWTWKIIWRMAKSYTHPVTLRGRNLHNGTPLWFQIDGQDSNTSPAPVLDPVHALRSSNSEENWVEWGSYVYIPTANLAMHP